MIRFTMQQTLRYVNWLVQREQYFALDASKVERYKLWTHTILTNTGKETTTEPPTSMLQTQPDKGKCPNWLTENHSLIQWFSRCCSKTNQKKTPWKLFGLVWICRVCAHEVWVSPHTITYRWRNNAPSSIAR